MAILKCHGRAHVVERSYKDQNEARASGRDANEILMWSCGSHNMEREVLATRVNHVLPTMKLIRSKATIEWKLKGSMVKLFN